MDNKENAKEKELAMLSASNANVNNTEEDEESKRACRGRPPAPPQGIAQV